MDSNYSPAMSEMSDAELDAYFATYVPLSNLPTPPPAKDGCVAEWAEVCDSELAGSCVLRHVFGFQGWRLISLMVFAGCFSSCFSSSYFLSFFWKLCFFFTGNH